MNLLLLKNGKVEIRTPQGSLVRTIGSGNAVQADFNADQSLVAITTLQGKIEIRTKLGSLVRTIGNGDAISVGWQGADLLLTTRKGRSELRKENGALIRTL